MKEKEKINIIIFGVSSGIGKYLYNSIKDININIYGFSSKKIKNKSILFYKYKKIKDTINLFKKLNKKQDNTYIVICNGTNGKVGRLENINLQNFIKCFEINFFSVLEIIFIYLKIFKKKNKKIIVFSGGGAFSPFVKFDSYASSKTALVRLVENLAKEYKNELQINAIAPGFNFTNIQKNLIKNNSKKNIGEEYFNFLLKNKKKINNFKKIDEFIKLVFFSKKFSLNGKTISINYDDWNSDKFKKNINKINISDYLTLRRSNKKPY